MTHDIRKYNDLFFKSGERECSFSLAFSAFIRILRHFRVFQVFFFSKLGEVQSENLH